MKLFKFKPHVYEHYYAPYYDKYKDHYFKITHIASGNDMRTHVLLECVTGDVLVNQYVDTFDIEEVENVDVEQLLSDILQEEIWKELESECGLTKDIYDQQIIDEMVKLANQKEKQNG